MPMELKLAKKLFVNDNFTASWTSNKNTFQASSQTLEAPKSELWKTFSTKGYLTSFQNPQGQSVLRFFMFVHPCLVVSYLLCY